MASAPGPSEDAPSSSPQPRPTAPIGEADRLARVLSRNIHALEEKRRAEEDDTTRQERLAGAITRFAGSMAFVYLHLGLVAFWILANLGLLPRIPRFDPSFVVLATIASVEAIFLSTFILISQNRAAGAEDRRAQLDLQVNLLAEHEITRLISLTVAIAERLDIHEARDPEIEELEKDIAPEAVLDEITAKETEQKAESPGVRIRRQGPAS